MKKADGDSPFSADPDCNREFRGYVARMGLDPNDPWLGSYVEYVARHEKAFFDLFGPLSGKRGLEFGCNFGATSIMLSIMGADIDAVDVDPTVVDIARRNAECYKTGALRFHHVPDTRRLPWADATFDFVSCVSVLEYVPRRDLKEILAEVNRVLRPGGKLFVLATSNRLWPVEVHSRRWFVNYLPQSVVERWASMFGNVQQGITARDITRQLRGYRNLDVAARNRFYLDAKSTLLGRSVKFAVLSFAGRMMGRLGIPLGTFAPSLCMVLEKPGVAC